MIYQQLLSIEIAERMLKTLFEINKDHIDFLNLGKIVIIMSTLGNRMYTTRRVVATDEIVVLG
jgi:hypothetical protein